MAVRAIRGATQVDADDREQVLEATRELVSAVLERNVSTTTTSSASCSPPHPTWCRSSPPWPPASWAWATCR